MEVLALFSQTLNPNASTPFKNSGKIMPQNLMLLFIIKATLPPFLSRPILSLDSISWRLCLLVFGQMGFLKASNINGCLFIKNISSFNLFSESDLTFH